MRQDYITMREVRNHYYKGMRIRVIKDDTGKPWVLGRDLGQVIGVKYPSRVVREYCKAPMMLTPIDSASLKAGTKGTYVIDHGDIYLLSLRYDMMDFNDWFCDKILPEVKWVEPEPVMVEVEPEPEPVEVEVEPEVEPKELTITDSKDFEFIGAKVTVLVDEAGNPWWIANEVCKVLGLDTSNLGKVLDKDEKTTHPVQYTEQVRHVIIINESGLYSLIFKSRKPQAKTFKKWVTSEVLPEIRKTGGYGKQKIVDELTKEDLAQMVLDVSKDKRKYQQLAQDEKARADEAERTKAWINSKKVATAMSTAATAVKRSNKILDDIGMGPKWKSVRAIHWLSLYIRMEFDAITEAEKNLVYISKVMKKPVKEAEHPMFSYVLTFHHTVIKKFREVLDGDPNYMKKYRLAKVYPK